MSAAAKRYARQDDYDGLIAQAAARYDVPFPLVKAIVACESGFKPDAQRGEPGGVVSYGLMQVTPAAAGLSAAQGPTLLDAATNIDRGTRYLAGHYHKLGKDEARAASAYNGGDRAGIGFGTRLTQPMTLCLAWRANAPPVGQGRTIAQHCASPYSAKAGEFGNQPYVNKVMEHRAYFAGPVPLTSNEMGAVATAALGVAVILLAARG